MAEWLQLKDFQLSLHVRGGEVSVFQLSDQDETTTKKYYGFVNAEGGWVIQRWDTAVDQFRWSGGRNNFTTAWTNRASLSYDYYYALFGTLI